ncbi:aldolase/citrate lyase family protein [Roseibium polysiphoniae]|uniref:HpcH/HpaI aldolase family protein n=1 Tax=Roseibium polysiphoniae TaxID=2571221 RepID=UPI003297062C
MHLQSASFSDAVNIGLAVCVMGTVEIVTVTCKAGYDFLLVDMEHGRIGIAEMTEICVAGLLAGLPVYARVTGPGSPDLSRVLDCGASGVVVPHVDTLEQAQSIVKRTRFMPVGERSLPGPLAICGFGSVKVPNLIEKAERTTRVIAMIESQSGLHAASDIAELEGIDGVMIGSNDLAASLGHLGDVGHPKVKQAFAEIGQAAELHGKSFGVMGLPTELIEDQALALSAGMIVATNEINLLSEGADRVLGEYRQISQNARTT